MYGRTSTLSILPFMSKTILPSYGFQQIILRHLVRETSSHHPGSYGKPSVSGACSPELICRTHFVGYLFARSYRERHRRASAQNRSPPAQRVRHPENTTPWCSPPLPAQQHMLRNGFIYSLHCGLCRLVADHQSLCCGTG